MLATADEPRALKLEDYISAYDSARAESACVDLTEFVPDPDDPHYVEVLESLIVGDMRKGWIEGNGRRLADYQRLFPASLRDRALLERVTREEYRLRMEAGEKPSPEEYEHRFGVRLVDWPRRDGRAANLGMRTEVYPGNGNRPPAPPSFACIGHDSPDDLYQAAVSYRQFRLGTGDNLDSWCKSFPGSRDHAELFRDLHRSGPESADRLAEAITTLPRRGDQFPRLPIDPGTGQRRLRPRLSRSPRRPRQSSGGTEGFERHVWRIAGAGTASAHQHRPHLLHAPSGAIPGRLHALLRGHDAQGRARSTWAAGPRFRNRERGW